MSVLQTRALGFQAIPHQVLDLSNVGATCLGALKQSIDCEEVVAELGQRQYHGSLKSITVTDTVCVASCKTALDSARGRMEEACAETPDMLPGMTVLSFIDSIITGWDETCLKDEISGEYCNNIIDALDEYDELEDIPKADLCSYCYGAKLSLMQRSEYSAYDEYYAAMLEYVNKECGMDYPITPIKEPPVYNGSRPDSCVSGKIIVTKEGDSCDSIAIANSVSGPTLYYINENLPNCTRIKAGLELCLPLPCTTHTITANDDFIELAVDSGVSYTDLIDWNLMLDSRCSNFWEGGPFWGRVICISPPGGKFKDGGSGGSVNPGKRDIGREGGSGNGYSDDFADTPTGEIGEGTIKNCGAYVQAQEGVGCAKMIVRANPSTPMDIFLRANPSLETAAKCDGNLKPGVWYCGTAHPLWNNERARQGGRTKHT
ncbi:hypothetical protein V501_10416 [Pseudogymnoascus sp. VKM F-4519 (FW-2642)]|nr:hypothetical protein V501_10416 [Pseudogymnoascus sp. VKM F-4519 (FW-2642)]